MIPVALICYTRGPEQVFYDSMPAVPVVGQTVHYSTTGTADDSRAWRVFNVSWVQDENTGDWAVEVALQ